MFEDLKQFVPSKVCLSCEGCCRFREAKSPWRPRIAEEERGSQNVTPLSRPKIFASSTVDPEGLLTTIPHGDAFICYFLDPETNACGVYHARPLECRLYPFVMAREPDGPGLFAHLSCPYVQETWDSEPFEQYREYLRVFFCRDDVKAFLGRNPGLLGEYSRFKDELEFLFPLDIP